MSTEDPSAAFNPVTWDALNEESNTLALAGFTARPDRDVITTAKIVSSEMRLDLNT
jgi:hypothetical protein